MKYEHEDAEWLRIDISSVYSILECLIIFDVELCGKTFDYWFDDSLEYIIDMLRDEYQDSYNVEEWEYNEKEKCIYIRKRSKYGK